MKTIRILTFMLAFVAPIVTQAQCKSFVKNKCLPGLENYTPSDKYNSLKLVQGEEAEVNLVFNPNHNYRVIVCTQDILGDVEYQILTDKGQVIFNSADSNGKSSFDFSTMSTQKLQVLIKVPDNDSASGLLHEGCVTIVIGSLPS
jgi:hypothetical protein